MRLDHAAGDAGHHQQDQRHGQADAPGERLNGAVGLALVHHHVIQAGAQVPEDQDQESDDEQAIRSVLGRLLFNQDDIRKQAKVLSGGEKGRMLFGKLMLQKPNILVMDEPTNHLDMESIESLNMALEMYPGTLIFVSHDREFVSSLANRVLEITPEKIVDFGGNYEDYLRSQGIE